MMQTRPDQGGPYDFARKFNDAREVLFGRNSHPKMMLDGSSFFNEVW